MSILPYALQEFPMKRSCGQIECTRIDTHMTPFTGSYSGELRKTDIIAYPKADARKVLGQE
ncbi:hypothetical protein PHLCEN_2v9306 [Hermanssonia centrifuga]|uniref:Uncharacterized protein n=1 Tax=Hermanssonia centrifuga TaxID=98765 RepID=A0A2R6NRA1_9APHY|nr:hypothetical protein PHLCEN_2v9306 [Hermanssonia centrifuga]